MAIVFDAASYAPTSASAVQSINWDHTIGSGAKRALVVSVMFYYTTTPAEISVTYNGVGLTKIGENSTTQWTLVIQQWILKEASMPSAGTYSIVVSTTAENQGSFAGGATSWSGVDQTTAAHNFNFGGAADAAPTVDITSATGEVVLDTLYYGTTVETHTFNQTQRWTYVNAATRNHAGQSAAGAATVTMSYTLTGAAAWQIAGCSLKDDAGDSNPALLFLY